MTAEKILIWLAWKLPRPIVKWAAVRLMAAATFKYPDRTPDEIGIFDALKAWD